MTVNTQAVGAAISTSPEQKTMVELINASTRELAKALPKHLSPERLARIATTCIRQNPKLAQCTPASFMGALFTCAQLGLEPVAGLAHLVPFNNSKKIDGEWVKLNEVQLIIGYKGIAELFYRHEKSGMIDWGVVHEKDEFAYELGTNAFLKHKPSTAERGRVVGYYCIYTLTNGLKKFNYMTHKECTDHGKKHSKTWITQEYNDKTHKMESCEPHWNKKSPWATNEDSMCLKTVLLQGSKTVPMSTELRRALETDETSREFKDGVTDALDLPVTTKWEEAEVEPVTKADTSKVADAIGKDPAGLTPEQIKALEERANKGKQTTEAPKDAPEGTQATANEDKGLSVKGIVLSHTPRKGKGSSKFNIEGSDLDFEVSDSMLEETILDHMKNKDVIEAAYQKIFKNDFYHYVITGISVQAQPGD